MHLKGISQTWNWNEIQPFHRLHFLSFINILTVQVDFFFSCPRIRNDYRDLKIGRQRRHGERQNSNKSKTTSWKTGKHTFCVHFFPIPARLRHESKVQQLGLFVSLYVPHEFIKAVTHWQQIWQSQTYCLLDSLFFYSLATDLHLI